MKLYFMLLFVFRLFEESTCLDYDGWLNIKIEHSIACNGPKYCTRGNISLKSLRAGTASIEQINFDKQHIQELRDIAETDGFYTIRTIVTSAEIKQLEFFSSMKAASYLQNGLSDVISVWVLPNGAVIAVSFQTTNVTLPLGYGEEYGINSNFFLRFIDQAPVPDTASYVQKLEREREAREKGDLKDNRSFLAKYWMYIIPIAIFVMISGASGPDPGAQGARQ